jgi:regulator of sirC expression with transglutaminase-like and TPR domain
VEEDLVRLFERPEEEIDLFSAALMIGRLESPDLDLNAYHQEIENMANEARSRWSEQAGSREKLEKLRTYLFEDNGYHGSRTDYYDRANSFINRVIDDREGIPITLSVLFLELGRKLGIEKLEGMPFPGHFMVRFRDDENRENEPIYIDVFDAGKFYRKGGLDAVISNHSEIPVRAEHFTPATKKEIILRILENLVAVSMRQENPGRTLAYLDLSLALSPEDPADRWRRALLRLQSGERTLARDDLKWLIEKQPAGLDLEQIEELYRRID